jgi:putative ABC transport system permease protein
MISPTDRHERLYRLLLLAFPPRFRAESGPSMERLFRDMCHERSSRSGALGFGFWGRVLWDTLSQAIIEWVLLLTNPRTRSARYGLGDRMASVLNDVRYAVRSVLRQPTYGVLIVLMMALAIAGNAAVFRVFNGLFLRPLPFEHAERLVDLDERAPQWDLEYTGVAYPDFARWRTDNRTFEKMGVLTSRGANFATDDRAEYVEVVMASYDVPEVFDFRPVVGRFFTAEEDRRDGPSVTLLSHTFWEDRFGSDPGVIGRTVSFNSRLFEVIGVLPPEAEVLGEAAAWTPLQEDESSSTGWYLTGVGRLKPGITLEQATDDLLAIHKGMIVDREVNEVTFPRVSWVRERYLGEYRLGSSMLLGAVAIVLLIACANIAGLMLARSLAREREIGIRVAMGAGRGRLVRQLLTESLLLAFVGAAAGTLLGVVGSAALVEKMAEQFPRWISFDLDWRFLAFSLAATVGAAVLFGLVPALQSSRVDAQSTLQASSSRTSASFRKRRSMNLLVGAEVALALTLLIVAGLSIRDILELQRVDPGFEADGLLTYSIGLPSTRYDTDESRQAFVSEHLQRIRALPGVNGATVASSLPLGGHWGWFFTVEDAPPRGDDEPHPVVLHRVVSPEYFETMGVTMVAGRPFDEFDGREEGTLAVVVNETFVETFMTDGIAPVGRRISSGGDSPWMTVVGVARDVRHYGVDEEMRPGVYQTITQFPLSRFQVAVRTSVDEASVSGQIRELLREADTQLSLYGLETMNQAMDESLWTRRASAWMIAAFSAIALTLAVAGLYGVISYGVGQRTHEISIRMALGAERKQVLRQVVRQGMLLVGIGVGLGLVASLAAARVVAGILVGVSATDPWVYAAVTVLLVAVAAVANLLPARRAAGLDPMAALRRE